MKKNLKLKNNFKLLKERWMKKELSLKNKSQN